MRKSPLLLVASLLFLLANPARAQFCPGVSPWVFDDVQASDPFCGFITWMAENGISLGCQIIDANHRLYCPSDNVTRKQMAAFMNRLGNVRVEAVDTGPGLTGGPITSTGTISADVTYLQRRVNGNCPAGSAITAVGIDGTVTCGSVGAGTVTSVGTGAGLAGGPITGSGTIVADTTYLQRRVSSNCAVGSAIRAINVDGTVVCQTAGAGTVTSVATGTGLTGGPITTGGTVSVAPGGIGTNELANGAVTQDKRAPLTFVTAFGAGAFGEGGAPGGVNVADAFIGPTVSVTLTTSRPIFMMVSKSLGSTVANANGLNISPCYQLAGGALLGQGGSIINLEVAAGTRQTFTINHVFTGLAPGTYTLGMCGYSFNAANWNSNDWGSISALVL